MDLDLGWSFTFDFDNFILISILQTTDVSFMPRVAVWISLYAWLIHGFGLCIFPSEPKKQDKIQELLQSQTTTPPVLDTILIEKQAIILPR